MPTLKQAMNMRATPRVSSPGPILTIAAEKARRERVPPMRM